MSKCVLVYAKMGLKIVYVHPKIKYIISTLYVFSRKYLKIGKWETRIIVFMSTPFSYLLQDKCL